MKKTSQKVVAKFKASKQQVSKFFGKQYVLLTVFWMIFTAMLIYLLFLFIQEQRMVDNDPAIKYIREQLKDPTVSGVVAETLYKKLIDLSRYKIIDFSLMKFDFFGQQNEIANYAAAWADRLKNINLAYSYVFISAAIALVALGCYFLINFKILRRKAFEKKYQLSTVYPNEYVLFNTKIYLDFISSLAIVFTFFNFVTTLIAVAYGIILVVVSTLNRWIFKVQNGAFLEKKWWKSSNFVFFTTVLIIQNSYTIAKSYFSIQFNVDVDLIVSLIIPIGTITVIVAVFIRNLLTSKITSVKNAVKAIMVRVTKFKIYLHSQDDRVFNDYSFMSDMPTLIKERFLSRAINNKEGLDLLSIIDDTIDFFRLHLEIPEELNYMLYHLFNDVREIAEIEEMRHNILQVKEIKDRKLRSKQKIISDNG